MMTINASSQLGGELEAAKPAKTFLRLPSYTCGKKESQDRMYQLEVIRNKACIQATGPLKLRYLFVYNEEI